MKRIILLIVILFSVSFGFGQDRDPCKPGFVRCRGNTDCIPARDCGVGPPPPGLVIPIDSEISLLIAAGISLGIFFLVSSGKKEMLD